MRFCDFFTRYKIGLKDFKSYIPFKELPIHRKIAISIIAILCIIFLIFYVISLNNEEYILARLGFILTFIAMLIVMFIFLKYDSKKENQETMLDKHYTPYSTERMNMLIGLLIEFGIDISNVDSINLLIDEAKNAQIKSDYLAGWEKIIKVIGTIVYTIFGIVIEKVVGNASLDEMIIWICVGVFCVFGFVSMVLAINICKTFFYSEYKKYDELIYDLRQIKIFYSKKSSFILKPSKFSYYCKRKAIKETEKSETEKSETDRKANALRSVLHNIFEKIKSWRT